MNKHITKHFPELLHGGDYNPEQWKDYPDIIDSDFDLFKKANVNSVSLGIFAWAHLEPEEGVYNFTFLDKIMDRLAEQNMSVLLATPSAAKPAWLSIKYESVNKMNEYGLRHSHGVRMVSCISDPFLRQKIRDINTALALHYKDHKALKMWHIANEMSGECFCPNCQIRFRKYLKEKYNNDLDKLNHDWWNAFWGHQYSSWEEIEAPSPIGEPYHEQLVLEWKRFVTKLQIENIINECKPLKEITPSIPTTTNFMASLDISDVMDYGVVKDYIDVVSWDNYPQWDSPKGNVYEGFKTAFAHDYFRTMKKKPFLLMESCPGSTNWQPVNKIKKPGIHHLSSLQAIAHGSDSVQYFQWRKSRGGSEKFHGAVVDHYGKEDTRTFNDVKAVGESLKKLNDVVGTMPKPRVAVYYDTENYWGSKIYCGLKRQSKQYTDVVRSFYKPLWERGIDCDVVDRSHSFDSYDLLILPCVYMASNELIEKIEKFVKSGKTVVANYLLGQVDENQLCHLDGFPGGKLKDVFGVRAEEIDSLYDEESNAAIANGQEYLIKDYCELLVLNEAKPIAVYKEDFYKGQPCATYNKYGKGNAYYIGFKSKDGKYYDMLFDKILKDLNITSCFEGELKEGLSAHSRQSETKRYIFLENFSNDTVTVKIKKPYKDILTNTEFNDTVTINKNQTLVFEENV